MEIGPGKGAITVLLLNACPRLNVVELDRDLIPILKPASVISQLVVHQADALKFDFSTLVEDKTPADCWQPALQYFHAVDFSFVELSRTRPRYAFYAAKEVVLRMAALSGRQQLRPLRHHDAVFLSG